jgi:hypothetical protein
MARYAPQPRIRVVRVGVLLFVALLLFPHLVMVWSPGAATRAVWAEAQHDSMISPSGDTWQAPESKTFDWKGDVYVSDLREPLSVLRVPALSPVATPFGSLRDLLTWFGYSGAFCLFVRAGWFLALIGAVMLVTAACRAPDGADPRVMHLASTTFGATLGGALALALVPALLCAVQVERARTAAERGDYAVSLRRLGWAARLLPVVRMNADFVDQIGLLEGRLGLQTAAAALHGARALSASGRHEEAEALFSTIASDEDAATSVRLEATRNLLRRGLRQLNSGETPAAVQTLEDVLKDDPLNVKASYALQLAFLRNGQYAEVEPLAVQVRAVYSYVNTLHKVPVLGAMQENVMYAAYLLGDPARAQAARQLLCDRSSLSKGR